MFSRMNVSVIFLVLLNYLQTAVLVGTGSGNEGKLRLCIVEGRGFYKRGPTYCPILDRDNAGVECVLGTDRLDCLRRISKGTVDFGVFSPEDLVAAQWADVDVLVTNELQMKPRPFARNIVAVINKRIHPFTPTTLNAVLRNTTLCHPGESMDDFRPITETFSGYLESLILEKSCDPKLSNTENKLKALAGFYKRACKAGPWVPDAERDKELKRQYPSLCAACNSPQCSPADRYWGNLGSLNCLYEGVGDITWGEAEDVTTYFKSQLGSKNFAYLCRDGSWAELSEKPCIWLRRPWNVIVAKRKAAEAVAKLASSLRSTDVTVDKHWPGALAALLESNQALPEPLHPPKTPLDYLAKAEGFREAYNQAGCDPPRHITLCTTSLLAKNKCEWLSEAGAVYGVVPPLQCAMKPDTEQCLKAVESGEIDVTMADSDWLVSGIRDFSLTPILHEITPIMEKSNTITAYIRNGTQITKMADLRGKRAAFPRFDGFAWHSMLNYVTEHEKISCKEFADSYFEEICAPGLDGKKCYEAGEEEAFKSLIDGKSDVAFISMPTFNKVKDDSIEEMPEFMKYFIPLCPEDNEEYCFISWSGLGHMFVANNQTSVRKHEIVNVFTKLDSIFGKKSPFHNPMFSMYNSYNHEMEVIFHSNTDLLATDAVLRTYPYDKIPYNFELRVSANTDYSCSFGAKFTPSLFLVLLSVIVIDFILF